MQKATRFKIGISIALVNLLLLVRAIGDVQYGPSWEVPTALITRLFNTAILSIALEVFILYWNFAAKRFKSQTRIARYLFWLASGLGVLLTIVICAANPEQWPNQNARLSAVVRAAEYPIMVSCGVLLAYLVVPFYRWPNR
jgi:hypothetical protein